MLRRPNQCWTASSAQDLTPHFVCDLNATDERIQQALDLLRVSPAFDIGDIAATLNLSPSRLRHLFKKQIGLSPSQYIKLLRLERAKSLLESSLLTVKEISARVGASDVSHFVRAYKAVYGHTPSDARTRWISYGMPDSVKSCLHRQLLLPLQNNDLEDQNIPSKRVRELPKGSPQDG